MREVEEIFLGCQLMKGLQHVEAELRLDQVAAVERRLTIDSQNALLLIEYVLGVRVKEPVTETMNEQLKRVFDKWVDILVLVPLAVLMQVERKEFEILLQYFLLFDEILIVLAHQLGQNGLRRAFFRHQIEVDQSAVALLQEVEMFLVGLLRNHLPA